MDEELGILREIVSLRQSQYNRAATAPVGDIAPDEVDERLIELLEARLRLVQASARADDGP